MAAKKAANKRKYPGIEEASKPIQEIKPLTQPANKPAKAVKAKGPIKGESVNKDFSKASRGRRVFRPFALEDPDELRAVPRSVHPGSILERIVYKRNLILYGPPSDLNWTAQHIPPENADIRMDFVYWFVDPPVVIEPQGFKFHNASARPGDDYRNFVIMSLGFRIYEIFDFDILNNSDAFLDNFITQCVGSPLPPYEQQYLFRYPEGIPPFLGLSTGNAVILDIFKEKVTRL